jgi:hypothetical protein
LLFLFLRDATLMGIGYKIRKAHETLHKLPEKERLRVKKLCAGIQSEQLRLMVDGKALFQRCISGCEGLCCRNVIADELITFRDIFFILAASSLSAADLLPLADKELLFTADCMFLKNGVGPCIFPDGIRPEKCVLSFCGDDRPIAGNIRSVHRGFVQLHRFLLFRNPSLLLVA